MKASLRSSSRFIIGLVVLLAATTRSFGSGGSECDDMDCSSFFAPEIIQDPNETPFFLSGHTFYSQPSYPTRSGNSNARDPQEDMDTVNLQEWSIYYRGAIPKTELSFLIYKMEPQYIVELVGSLRGKEVVLSSEAKSLKTDFAKYGKTGRVIQSLEYLLLAKRVEPFAISLAAFCRASGRSGRRFASGRVVYR